MLATHTMSIRNIGLAITTALLAIVWATPAQAATMELTSEAPETHFTLKAKVAYLTAFVEALREGELSPEPTFVTALRSDAVTVAGTVARTPQPDRVETCGPMVKGEIDWGDGTVEDLYGLGCSGDAHAFTRHHRYAESGSYEITVTDTEGRETSRVVAVRVAENDGAPEINVDVSGQAVALSGQLVLDDAIASSCVDASIASVHWGDGSGELLTCADGTTFSFSHSYSSPGSYKVYVRDRDGDMTQTVVTVE